MPPLPLPPPNTRHNPPTRSQLKKNLNTFEIASNDFSVSVGRGL